MKNKTILLLIIFLCVAFPLFSQESKAILEYYDDDYEIQVFDDQGKDLTPEVLDYGYGFELLEGYQIKTKNTSAEIRLVPNGSMVKLDYNTDFLIESLQGSESTSANAFTLTTGKLHCIAARMSGQERYSIVTPSVVCGVRGTQFILDEVSATVKEGSVVLQNLDSGESVTLEPGQFADASARRFKAETLSPQEINERFEGLDFKSPNVSKIPGYEAPKENMDLAAADTGNDAETENGSENTADSDGGDSGSDVDMGQDTTAGVGAITPGVDDSQNNNESSDSDKSQDEPENKLAQVLGDVMGFEVAAMNINGKTYSRAVLQPTLKFGKFAMTLYFPIIYQNNLFDPDDWYRPNGNNEWSFGSDQNGKPLPIIMDIISDLWLKIKSIEYGKQGKDKFYFKFGNVSEMTMGHGTIMNKYANDVDFPAIRRVGINVGFEKGPIGLEGMLNDAADPSLFGGRFLVRPIPKYQPFGIGLTGLIDIRLAKDFDKNSMMARSKPILIGTGIDLEFFKVSNSLLSILGFADYATLLPYFRETVSDGIRSVSKGLAKDILYYDKKLKNFGITAGFRGNVAILDWSLEYRFYNGLYKHGVFDNRYERLRSNYLEEMIDYLQNPSAKKEKASMGIYGEAGLNILEKVFFTAGYFWPWSITDAGVQFDESADSIHLELKVPSGTIPKVNIHGSISYDRTGLVRTFRQAAEGAVKNGEVDLHLLDSYTTLKGTLAYGLTENLDIVCIVSTAIKKDPETGEVFYREDGSPEIVPIISLETRVKF